MTHSYNGVEDYVKRLLRRIDIYYPHQLNEEDISQRLGMVLSYIPFESACMDDFIFIDSRKDHAGQWENFGHELCHALWHAVDQAIIPLSMREYQEWKAENFSQHLCIPSVMLDRMKLPADKRRAIWMVTEEFGVTREFAKKRLDQYVRNQFWDSRKEG